MGARCKWYNLKTGRSITVVFRVNREHLPVARHLARPPEDDEVIGYGRPTMKWSSGWWRAAMADIADFLTCRKADATSKLLSIHDLAEACHPTGLVDTPLGFRRRDVSEVYAPATFSHAGPPALAEEHYMRTNLASTVCSAH